ncbi:MAG: beta-ketoacyl-[acyl-carrier-protein] synthase family protein, partial [Ferruginibacter sp.]
MNAPVFVAGTGIISAIGNNVAECLDALENERAGMGQMHNLDSVHRQRLPVAEVKLSNDELTKLAGFPKTKSRTALLSMIAAREALDDAGIKNITSLRTGFISANSVGGMDKTE